MSAGSLPPDLPICATQSHPVQTQQLACRLGTLQWTKCLLLLIKQKFVNSFINYRIVVYVVIFICLQLDDIHKKVVSYITPPISSHSFDRIQNVHVIKTIHCVLTRDQGNASWSSCPAGLLGCSAHLNQHNERHLNTHNKTLSCRQQ